MYRTPALRSRARRLAWVLILALASSCAAPVSLTAPAPPPSVTPVLSTVPAAMTLPPAPATSVSPGANTSRLLPASGIRIEEHALLDRPALEPLSFTSQDGRNKLVLMGEHASLLHQRLPAESYYSVGRGNLRVMQGNDRLDAVEVGGDDVSATVTRNGEAFFSVPNRSPGVTSPFRVLTTYGDHWALEVAQRVVNSDGSIGFAGRVFVDGESLNDQYGYEETFGFQTMAGRPFYFYKRTGLIGVVVAGEDVPLGYEQVPHYGCCSAGELNARTARNMLAFFAQRAGRWYYVEIGAFDEDR